MKKNVLLYATALTILSISNAVYATAVPGFGAEGVTGDFIRWKPTTLAVDVGRTVNGVIESIIGLFGDGEAKAQLIATQEENNKNTSGEEGTSDSTDTTSGSLGGDVSGSAGASEFSGYAFTYVNANIFSKEGGIGNITYQPLKTALTSETDTASIRQNLRTTVLKNFFADPTKSDESTAEYKDKIRTKRNTYIQEASNRHVTLGYQVKGHIQNDLSVISSVPITGDGELGAIAVDAHTLEQMVKIALVDLALQIEMMEADAIHFLMQQPVELMSETKPTN